ncbi:tail fiber assembly protein [Escherichia coli]|nr:tail fiber assembly protein [Escherichia coli]
MSDFIFSPKNNAFYPLELEEDYVYAGSWPTDGIGVDSSVFREYTGKPPEGKIRIVGSDGLPAWGDIPEPSSEELIATAETERLARIGQANAYMNDKQWPGKAALGRLTDTEKKQYNLWLDYLDALEAVDTSSAPDINWPVAPEE